MVFGSEKGRSGVCRPHSSRRYCMAPQRHLQAAAVAAWYIHGPYDHGWQPQIHTHHGKWQKEKVTTSPQRRPTGICPGAPSLQHLHL